MRERPYSPFKPPRRRPAAHRAGGRFVLTLEPLPGKLPAIVRLRRLLKRLLRSGGFRCVRIEETDA